MTVITGASSGIGAEFARQLAERGQDLVITARRENRLQKLADELKGRFRVSVFVVPSDLAEPGGPAVLESEVRAIGRPVGALINNAGLNLEGRLLDHSFELHRSFLQLMLVTPLELIHRFLPEMLHQGAGTVINVASVSNWWPHTAWNTLYSPTKRALVTATRGLAEEYRSSGVTFTALCPGVTKTEIVEKGRTAAAVAKYPGFLVSTPAEVVAAGLAGARAGKTVVVVGTANRVICGLLRALPERLISPPLGRYLSKTYGSTTKGAVENADPFDGAHVVNGPRR